MSRYSFLEKPFEAIAEKLLRSAEKSNPSKGLLHGTKAGTEGAHTLRDWFEAGIGRLLGRTPEQNAESAAKAIDLSAKGLSRKVMYPLRDAMERGIGNMTGRSAEESAEAATKDISQTVKHVAKSIWSKLFGKAEKGAATATKDAAGASAETAAEHAGARSASGAAGTTTENAAHDASRGTAGTADHAATGEAPGAKDTHAGETPGAKPGQAEDAGTKKPGYTKPSGNPEEWTTEQIKEAADRAEALKRFNAANAKKGFKGWAKEHPGQAIAAGAAVASIGGAAVVVGTNGVGKLGGLAQDVGGAAELWTGFQEITHGKTDDGEKDIAKALTGSAGRRLLEADGFSPFFALIISFIASLFSGKIVDALNGGNHQQAAPATGPAPVVDKGPTTPHTGLAPAALASDTQLQTDVQNVQQAMRLDGGVSGYTGPKDGQLTPDTIMGMQKTLAHSNQYNGPIDGTLNPAFVNALVQDNGVVGSAKLSFHSLGSLNNYAQNPAAAAPVPDAAPAPTAPGVVPLSVDPLKQELQMTQTLLREAVNPQTGKSYYGGAITGELDDKTTQAVKAFQAQHPDALADGLGVLGAHTGQALLQQYQADMAKSNGGKLLTGTDLQNSVLDATNRALNTPAPDGSAAVSPTAYTPPANPQSLIHNADYIAPQTPAGNPSVLAAARTAVAGMVISQAHADELPPNMRPHGLTPPVAPQTNTHGAPETHGAALPAPVPPVPATPQRLAVNDNMSPHSDAAPPAPVPAAPTTGGEGMVDRLADTAGVGLSALSILPIPFLGQIDGIVQVGLAGARFVGDAATGHLKEGATRSAADLVFAGADAIPLVGGEASIALRLASNGIKADKSAGNIVSNVVHAIFGVGRSIRPGMAAAKLGTMGGGMGMENAADSMTSVNHDTPIHAPATPVKPHANDDQTHALVV